MKKLPPTYLTPSALLAGVALYLVAATGNVAWVIPALLLAYLALAENL
jgi:hypothetical protein